MIDNISTAPCTPLPVKPIETRRSTDKFFFLLCPINLSLWLGIGIYEICKDNPYKNHTSYVFNSILRRNIVDFTIHGTVAVLVMILLLSILHKMKDKWTVFVLTSFVVVIILNLIALTPLLLVIFIDLNLTSYSLLLTFTMIVVCLIYHVTIFICTKDVGVSLLAQMINMSCRAILHSFVVLLLSLVILFLSITVLIFTVNILLTKMTLDHSTAEYSPIKYLVWIRIYLFIIGGMYIFNFIWNFGFMVMVDYSAKFYGIFGNEKVPQSYVFRSILKIIRYHLGTVAFLSTPILPSICATVMAFKNNRQYSRQSDYKLIHFISKTCLIANISDFALIKTLIFGYKTLRSIKEMFDLHHSNSSVFLTLNAISFKVMEISIIIAVIIGIIIQTLIYIYHPPMEINIYLLIVDTFMTVFYINLINKLYIRPSMCTFLIYKMIGLRTSKESEDRPTSAEP